MPKIQPKSGANHKLFGTRFMKLHNMRNDKWTPSDKITQYNCMITIHEKNHDLLSLKAKSDYNAQNEKLKEEVTKVKDCRVKLKDVQCGDTQRIKNIFQNHRAMQRLYPNLSTEKITDSVDYRTFVKQKRFDRLSYKKKQLTEIYEKRLDELGKLQDRVKYQDSLELEDEISAKSLTAQLEDSETRVKSLKAFQRNSSDFIHTLVKDLMYYDSVLGALQDDVKEQTDLINTTIEVGLPAIINMDKYSKDYNMLEKGTRNQSRIRLATLNEYRQKLADNKFKIKKLVRGENDFEVYPDRYLRETRSMVSLQTDFSQVQNDMKELCAAVACDNPERVSSSLKLDLAKGVEMKKKTVSLENLLKDVTVKVEQAKKTEDSLVNNYTKTDAALNADFAQIKSYISKEKVDGQSIENELKIRRDMKFQLQNSLQHLCNLLQNVGPQQKKFTKMYKSSVLELPLLELQYGNTVKTEPPATIEEDIKILLETLTSCISFLLDIYNSKQGEYGQNASLVDKLYHEDVLAILQNGATKVAASPDGDIFDISIDSQVMDREQIKLISEKIVVEKAKQDD